MSILCAFRYTSLLFDFASGTLFSLAKIHKCHKSIVRPPCVVAFVVTNPSAYHLRTTQAPHRPQLFVRKTNASRARARGSFRRAVSTFLDVRRRNDLISRIVEIRVLSYVYLWPSSVSVWFTYSIVRKFERDLIGIRCVFYE